jgi:demethylmenaquinone methyltransferase/2-methoxy-6-polyprenyl-1,4-benzoquinol methylase
MLTQDNLTIRHHFDEIAGRYDLANRVLSLGIDVRWRRFAIRQLTSVPAGAAILDLACGTCDMARELMRRRPGDRVVGADLSRRMLELGRKKVNGMGLVNAPAEALPFADGTFDAVMIAFGIRNVPDYPAGLREMLRVLKPGGKACILEFSTPPNTLFSRVYRLYFLHVLPRIGGWLTGRQAAYRYLTDSVSDFPGADALQQAMQDAGFADVAYRRLTAGIVCVHTGVRR